MFVAGSQTHQSVMCFKQRFPLTPGCLIGGILYFMVCFGVGRLWHSMNHPSCLRFRDPYHHGLWNNPQKNWVGFHPQPIYPKQTGTFSLLNCGSKMVQNFRGVSGSVIPYSQKKNQPGCWSLLMWSGRFLIQIMVLAWQFPTVLHIFLFLLSQRIMK